MPVTPLPNLRGIIVLVVEDHLDTREMFEQLLTETGALVITATSAAEALRLTQQALPAVIVIDIFVPGEDAFWFMRQLRALKGGSGLPVIGLSSRPLDLLGPTLRESGFEIALMKPVDPVDLCDIISKVVARTVAARSGARHSTSLKLGDFVGAASKPDWVGEVVDTSRLRSGYVTVRWRTASGMALQSMEERTDTLARLPPNPGRRAGGSCA
jgi:CheY-like chemotaxis protein